MVGNPSDIDFQDSDARDYGDFDDEFDEYEDNVASDMEERAILRAINE